MKINFVTESGRWILGRWCDEWAKCIPGSSVNTSAQTGMANIYVNYHLWNGIKTELDICYFTHKERTNQELISSFEKTSQDADWCIAQCDITANLLPPEKTSIVRPGVGAHFIKGDITIGVPVKPQPSDRKRLSWAFSLEQIPGVKIKLANGDIKYEDMPYWYDSVDYVLITSENEGGPMGVLEALARNKPLILPTDVGWCNDYPALRFTTLEELQTLVGSLRYNRQSWIEGAQQIVELVDKLTNK